MQPEAGVPGAEGVFQSGIQYMHSHGKKRLNGERVRQEVGGRLGLRPA
jgi:hypothetical protein